MLVGSMTLEYVKYIMWPLEYFFTIHTFKLNLDILVELGWVSRLVAHPPYSSVNKDKAAQM